MTSVACPKGYYIYTIEEDPESNKLSVYDQRRESYQPGFGIESTRALMKISFENGYEGRLYNDASWSSHIFHLYMGMIPRERKISVVDVNFGIEGRCAMEKLTLIWMQYKTPSFSPEKHESSIQTLKSMLHYARTRKLSFKKSAGLTLEDVINGWKELDTLGRETCSYIENCFILGCDKLIALLLKHHRFPQTNSSRFMYNIFS